MEPTPRVFISYAWEGSLAPKRWLAPVVEHLQFFDFSVFFDRSSINYGDDINEVIANYLSHRPLVVLCMCDDAYCKAARTLGSGVHAEVQAISRMQGASGFSVVPIFLEPPSHVASNLPPVLAGKLGLVVPTGEDRQHALSGALVKLLFGGTQDVVQGHIDEVLATTELRRCLTTALEATFKIISGNPRDQTVKVDHEELTFGPALLSRPEFMDYLAGNSESGHVLWYWSGRGTGPCTLGAAIVAHCFPLAAQRNSRDVVAAGKLLASAVFSYVRYDEPLLMSPEDVVSALTDDVHSHELVRRLLSAP
jgi:TIR domain